MDVAVLQRLDNENDLSEFFTKFNKKYSQTFSFPEYSLETKKAFLNITFEHLLANQNVNALGLEAIRILSRDKNQLDSLFTKQIIGTLVNLAGLITSEEDLISKGLQVNDAQCMVEAQKVLCNLIYNSTTIQRECCTNGCIEGIMLRLKTYKDPGLPHEIKFFDMRMLFLLTALCADIRPKLCVQFHGLTYLMEVLDLVLKDNVDHAHNPDTKRKYSKRGKKGRTTQSESENELFYVPCLDDEEVDLLCEVLKVLFNLTVNVQKYNIEEEEEAHYMRLVSILHDMLLCEAKTQTKKDELHSHTIDLLTNMPPASYEELLTPVIDIPDTPKDTSIEFEGMNMEVIDVLLQFLEKRLNQPNKTYKELLSPVLTTLCEASRSNSYIRKFLRQKVLPPLRDVMNRPEEGTTLRNKLVKLMTSPVFDVKELVADFLFILCKEKVARLIKYTGYGNAAGLLANRGLLLGGRGTGHYSSDSEESDTEEYLQYKDKINPVVGCYQELKPNPMEGMTEEQKEHEAMQLVNMMDKMARDGIIQPVKVGIDGKPHAVGHVLELQEEWSSQRESKSNHQNGDSSD